VIEESLLDSYQLHQPFLALVREQYQAVNWSH
jgi:hypothetical protein